MSRCADADADFVQMSKWADADAVVDTDVDAEDKHMSRLADELMLILVMLLILMLMMSRWADADAVVDACQLVDLEIFPINALVRSFARFWVWRHVRCHRLKEGGRQDCRPTWNKSKDGLVSLVETLETFLTVEIMETVETVKTEETVWIEDLKSMN